MPTRDPRLLRDGFSTGGPSRDNVREPTQSLQLDSDDLAAEDDSDGDGDPSQSLARGTREARDSHTKIESPAAHRRTSELSADEPPRKSSRRRQPASVARGDDPNDYLGTMLGAYRVDDLLGKGGMGYVFRAEHVKLGRVVALKLLRADYARRRDAVARFFQEARAVVRIRHRNIVDVTDWVELDDGTTFIIMELLSGTSLGKWARSGVDLPRALAVLVQICDGLSAAHAVGVIHRDLKPDNVIVSLTDDGGELVKLLDFGVAKLVNREDEDVGFQTAAGSVIGTPAYMSPEQAGGMAIDHRSDIYSLGAIMYEMFCGQPMFRGRSFGEYVRKHLTEMPVRPRATTGGRDLDDRLEALILKALEKDPAQRFGDILELRDGLMTLFGGIETMDPVPVRAASPVRLRATQVPIVQPGGPLPAAPPVYPQPTPPTAAPAPISVVAGVPSLVPGASAIAPMSAPVMALPVYAGTPAHWTGSGSVASVPAYLAPGRRTPWYKWMLGALVAVGLGIVGAWYVTRDVIHDRPTGGRTTTATAAAHAAAPTPAPTVAPAEPAAPSIVGVRFDSLPAAHVFAAGHAVELCQTPCAFDVDLKDGGPTDRRAFVVHADGYADKQVVVDLADASADRDFHVTLDQAARPPVAQPTTSPPHGRSGTRHPTKSTTPTPAESTKPEPKPSPRVPDATDTLDPFAK